MKSRVMIAMSGGVDSAIVAYLVRKAGYDTVAATMQLGSLYGEPQNACCSERSVLDARSMASALGIPHQVYDLTDDFRREVADYFIKTYRSGGTPNPCVVCNRRIKFGRLLELALEDGCDMMATGHYACIRRNGERYLLCRAVDRAKDQTYVLWQLSQHQLSHTLFPLADYTKSQVKQLAEQLELVAAHKHESQDICFIPDGDYAAFITRATGHSPVPGSFIAEDGSILGQHRGLIHYTSGQRKGLGIAFGEPMYVKSKSVEQNTVTLCRAEQLFSDRLTAHSINLIACDRIDVPLRVTAKVRYSQSEVSAIVTQSAEDELVLELGTPQRAISPGQSVVLYDGDVVIGGGIIC